MFEFLFKYSRESFDRGELLFASSWPVWLMVVLLLVAAVGISISLIRNQHDFGWFRLSTIGLMQLAVVAVLLVMLWQPALLTQTLRAQENTIAVLLDTSASMGYGEGEQSRLQQAVATLETGALPDLEEQFQVDLIGFSEQTIGLPSLDTVPAPGQRTDIGASLLSVLRGASAGALAAVVLVSDGADNSTDLDAARIAEIAGFGVPVHTLGVGREVLTEDIELEDVVLAPRSSPGATVSAQVSIRHGQAGQAQLKVYDGDAILASETIQLPDQAGVTTRWIDIEVGDSGIRDLRFTIDPVGVETNLVNNTQLRPVEVPSRRRAVLYFEGEPRYEYKFIRRAIDTEGPIRVASIIRTTPNKVYRQGLTSAEELENGFPSTAEELFDYDALIIGSLPAADLTDEQQQLIYDFVSRRGGTLLMLGSRRGLADGGWGASVVADLLPAALPDIDAPTFVREPVRVMLPADSDSLITRLDADPDQNRAIWEEMPWLKDLQRIEPDSLKPGAEVLLEAELDGETWPALIRHRFGQGSVYILAGSTWGWQMSLHHEDQKHETFWQQLLQAMTASAPEPVSLTSERVYFGDQAAVVLRADVRDSAYEAATTAEVSLAIDTPGADRETLRMQPVAGMPGRYELTVDAAAQGIYRFEAEADLDGELLGSSRLAIRREDGVSEHFRVQQNRVLLERLADATGGRYFALNDADDIPEAVQFSDAGIVERRLLDLWNMPALFLLLILAKAGEWVLRLRWGRL